MAIIKTPGAGVSPYQTATDTPTVLRAGADGTTVLAAAATGANTSVYVSGQAALNSLITTSQSGVFEGANVTINLEEQNFNTTNQVVSTTNYPAGNTGEIQYNSGSNSFASNAFFTYASGNVITPGIRTDNYLYANGAPFLAGGNAAIGNFVFTGDNMTISHANSALNINGNGTGNVTVTANASSTWNFDSTGALIFPSNAEITVDNTGAAVFQHEGGVTIAETNGNSFVYNTVIELFDNAVHLGTNQQGNAYSWDFSQDGSLSVPGNITGANVVSANVYTALSNVTVTANVSNWIFGTNGILTLPGNSRVTPVGANIEIQAAAGGYAEIVTSDGNSRVSVTNGGAEIVTSGTYTWSFDNVGNLVLPGNTFAVKYANGDPVVISAGGLPLANGTSNIDIATANGNVTIAANASSTWTFNTDGNLTLPAAGNIVGAANIIGNGAGNVNVNANSRVWTFAADGSLVLPLAGNIVNYGNVWTFGYDGNLTFPTGNLVIIPDDAAEANAAFIRSTDHVIALLSTGVNGGAQSVWIEDVANIGTSNTAAVRVSPVSQTGNVQIQTGNNSSINTWNFGYDGNLVLPGNVIAINYANGNRVTGNITFRDEIVIGTGTSNLISGLYLAPSSSSADASMYLRVRGNITDEPTHIHFDTGNNAYYNQFIGDDNKYIQLANTGNIVINSNDGVGNAAQWNFDVNGVLTVPGEGIINSVNDTVVLRSFNTTTGNANSVYLGTSGGLGFSDQAIGANWLEIFRSGTEPQIQTTVGNLLIQTTSNSTPYNWNFGSTGNLTVPGSIILPANSLITGAAASPAPSLNGFNSVSAVDLSASGNVTAAIVSATGNIIGNTAGFAIGYLNVPQVSFSGNATIAATDAGKHYYSTLSTANVLTIANNTSVTWAVGTAISLVNRGTGNITVAQGTGVSLYLAGNATAGNRTVATYGMVTLLNVAANIWMINGTGVS